MSTVKEYQTYVCADCGASAKNSYMEPIASRMLAHKRCFTCDFWEDRCAQKHATVIDHCTYSPGNNTSGRDRGMAGRRFDIEYFADGRRVTTYDLWSGGEIPERYRDRIPNTARFLGGAERADAGGTTCWNPADDRTPPYPLPNGRPAPWPYGMEAARRIGELAKALIPRTQGPL